jgi:RNAse (barnase) inhibitor barstar
MSNFIILTATTSLASFSKYRIGQIDSSKTPTLKLFYQAIEKALDFPDDFEHNLDSLDEFFNDLGWIQETDLALYLTDSEAFLTQEKPAKVIELLNLLDAIAEDWKWVDDDMEPKNFKVLIEYSPRIVSLLEKEEIAFDSIG